MRGGAQLAAHVLSTACGVLMVAAVGIGAHGSTLVAATSAVAAVTIAVLFRPVATLAVLLTVVAIALSGPPATVAAVSGLSAAVYLVLRHAASNGAGLDSVSGATMVVSGGIYPCRPGCDRISVAAAMVAVAGAAGRICGLSAGHAAVPRGTSDG